MIFFSYRARQLKTWVNQCNDVIIKTGFKANDVVDHIVNLDKEEKTPVAQSQHGVLYIVCFVI